MVEVKGKVEADLVAVGWEMEVGDLEVVVLVMAEVELVVEVEEKVMSGLVWVGVDLVVVAIILVVADLEAGEMVTMVEVGCQVVVMVCSLLVVG